ncbi:MULTISPECIES: TraI DNA relaxase [unclassified Rhodococcus (in: high G+C Gram-positive bacteria)]|uniref:TraI DNA relaxase n=1 Tax=unclassified Rhodococcus (in: high G+C Gram-positive bacteria) TaxID=192944 RepID=UPI003398C63D
MNTGSVSTGEHQRRSQIAAAAYERGRRAALAAIHRKGLHQRAQTRRDVVQTRPAEYRPRSDSRAFNMIDTDLALARAAAYMAAATVAHEMIPTEAIPNEQAAQDWSAAALNRTGVHEDAWRERLTDAGIDEAVLRPGLSVDALDELPAQLDGLDFDEIAEHTLDVSSTAADVEPIRLSDLMLETPSQTQSSDSAIDVTGNLAQVIELDHGRDAAFEGGVDTW